MSSSAIGVAARSRTPHPWDPVLLPYALGASSPTGECRRGSVHPFCVRLRRVATPSVDRGGEEVGMGSVIGDLLPLAVGVAVSPIPIIAAILMLLSKRAGSTSVGFALGWILGIVVATVIFVLLSSKLGDSEGDPSATVSWIKLALGVLLLAFGVKQWRGRGGEHETPKWMHAIDDMTAVKGLGLGFALAAINPKNLM